MSVLHSLKSFVRYFATGATGLALIVAAWWLTVDSFPFWKLAAATGTNPLSLAGVKFYASAWLGLFFLFAALGTLLAAIMDRRLYKTLLIILSLIGAGGFGFSLLYGAVMSPDMLRNAFATNVAETRDLISPGLIFTFLCAAIPPILLIWKFPLKPAPLKDHAMWFLAAIALVIFGIVSLLADFQGFSYFIRGQKSARYLLTPVNIVYSAVKTQFSDEAPGSVKVRTIVDKTPTLSPAPSATERPLLVVVVTGETARAANWGLDGYDRDTTPELRKEGVVNYTDASSCGTSTDVSVPCMFSRIGRENYNRKKIITEEPLPAVLQRAGVKTLWVDNQGGDKGASQGTPYTEPVKSLPKALRDSVCPNGECYDEGMVPYIDQEKLKPGTVNALFFHMMGSHGPAYAKRYPEKFNKWGPVCTNSDLRSCDPKSIRNAYDNSILYTDHVLSSMIDKLKAMKDADTALIYMSDHGESLGEKGLFLHGAPYAIAPSEQTHIPMILWVSDGLRSRLGIAKGCLEAGAKKPVSHDDIWSTVLALTQVKSSTYNAKQDITAACRKPSK